MLHIFRYIFSFRICLQLHIMYMVYSTYYTCMKEVHPFLSITITPLQIDISRTSHAQRVTHRTLSYDYLILILQFAFGMLMLIVCFFIINFNICICFTFSMLYQLFLLFKFQACVFLIINYIFDYTFFLQKENYSNSSFNGA